VSRYFSLAAVFIPVLFMGGIMGRLFRVRRIGAAILISGFVPSARTDAVCRFCAPPQSRTLLPQSERSSTASAQAMVVPAASFATGF
jgi:multidrug efflux pump subunit AcrB